MLTKVLDDVHVKNDTLVTQESSLAHNINHKVVVFKSVYFIVSQLVNYCCHVSNVSQSIVALHQDNGGTKGFPKITGSRSCQMGSDV